MSRRWTPAATHRAVMLAAAVVGGALLLPAVPTIASAFAPSGTSSAAGPATGVVHLEIVAPGVTPLSGQLTQPTNEITVYVQCPSGRAVGGGYALPNGTKHAMVVSAPSDDGKQWNFRYAGLVPIGTKYYAICSGS